MDEREASVVVIVLTYLYLLKLVRVFVYAGTRVRDTSNLQVPAYTNTRVDYDNIAADEDQPECV